MVDLNALSRRELQNLAKKEGIRANQKTSDLVAQLSAAQNETNAENDSNDFNTLAEQVDKLNLGDDRSEDQSDSEAAGSEANGHTTNNNSNEADNRTNTEESTDAAEVEDVLGELPQRLSKSMRAPSSLRHSSSASDLPTGIPQRSIALRTTTSSKVDEFGDGMDEGKSASARPQDAVKSAFEESVRATEARFNADRIAKARKSLGYQPRQTACPAELSASLASRQSLERAVAAAHSKPGASGPEKIWVGAAEETPASIVDERIRIAVNAIAALQAGDHGSSFDQICGFIKKTPTPFYDKGSTAVQLHRALRVAVEENALISKTSASGEVRFAMPPGTSVSMLAASATTATTTSAPLPVNSNGASDRSGALRKLDDDLPSPPAIPAIPEAKPLRLGAKDDRDLKTPSALLRPGSKARVSNALKRPDDVATRLRSAVKTERLRRNKLRQQLRRDLMQQQLDGARGAANSVQESLLPRNLHCENCKAALSQTGSTQMELTRLPSSVPAEAAEEAPLEVDVDESFVEETRAAPSQSQSQSQSRGPWETPAPKQTRVKAVSALSPVQMDPVEMMKTLGPEHKDWELRESRSKPGRFYFYNRVTHKTKWKMTD
ncbi:Nucleolar and spindle-associated protein 1 [Hondaea fermentalgiana]|uniref:Nucleolar and spindle-associated protein 1 n=1 Tax=Hondaea fermentalgiana TaxID=2315210 RepID=A0A2R5GEV0_9STRA|nr:Nucleolar and spindle-associated protein 1 [Hondaea fermentalgiana]|eukprot:GBG29450.1 Nucleolar and spindle-associated protein 1 [Hondaea fermentalgiana]